MSVRSTRSIRSIRSVRSGALTAVLAATLAAGLVACSDATTSQGPGGDVPYVAPSVNAAAASTAAEKAEAAASPSPRSTELTEADMNRPQKVRDTFAGLQATLNETCTPGAGDCAYFLGRVNDELAGLDKSMKADPKGPGHFKEPLAWMSTLRTTLNGDTSTPNLEKHMSELIGTRDRINTWMQGHPDDYR